MCDARSVADLASEVSCKHRKLFGVALNDSDPARFLIVLGPSTNVTSLPTAVRSFIRHLQEMRSVEVSNDEQRVCEPSLMEQFSALGFSEISVSCYFLHFMSKDLSLDFLFIHLTLFSPLSSFTLVDESTLEIPPMRVVRLMCARP